VYQFLDRPIALLPEPHAFLLSAMRIWVASARGGRCPCRTLLQGFVRRGVPDMLPDFGIAMAALDRDGLSRLSFAPDGATVGEGEARALALFDAALAGGAVRRIAAVLVAEDAVSALTLAAERVALRLCDGVFVERDA
jgi:hypothetical protein